MRDTPTIARARALRVKHPDAPARARLAWACSPQPDPIDWEEGRDGMLSATLTRDGFNVTVRTVYDYDSDLSWLGTFTDHETTTTVRNPRAWSIDGERDHGTYAYIELSASEQEHFTSLHAMGYSRGVARVMARSYVRRDVERLLSVGDDWALIAVVCDVTRAGIHLGEFSLWGIDVDSPHDPYVTEIAWEVISDALYVARSNLDHLLTDAPG